MRLDVNEGVSEVWSLVCAKFGTLRVQDVALVVLSALVIYLLRVRDHHVIRPQWRHNLNLSHYPNGKFPTYEQRLPLPVITDLEGDGISEVVLVNSMLTLQVLRLPPDGLSSVLPDLEVQSSTQLPSHSGSAGKSRLNQKETHAMPIAIETGFVQAYSHENRKQVIAVLLDNWTVLCYDNNLRLLWERVIQNTTDLHADYYMKSASLLVTSTQVSRGDRGLIIVGASYAHRSYDDQKPVRPFEDLEGGAEHPAKRVRAHVDAKNAATAVDNMTHFSTYGLSGQDGTIRWHHMPGDYQQQDQDEGPVFHWKLALKRTLGHVGEEPWQRYSDDVLKLLPYMWASIYDTRMDLAKLNKNKRSQLLETPKIEPALPGAKTKKDFELSTAAQDLLGLTSHHEEGVAYGGMKPHKHHEHVVNPNAIIIHSHNGIEILSLTNGRPVTRVEFLDEKAAFVDVNDDGNLERVSANYVDNNCQAEVASLSPALRVLYSGSICDAPGLFNQVSLSAIYSDTQPSEDTHVSLPPALIKSIAHRVAPWQHLVGAALPSQRKGYDAVFLTSTGRLTSYGPTGDFNWQVVLSSGWSEIAHVVQTGSFNGNEMFEIFNTAFQPSITAFSRQVYGPKTLLLSVGWDSVSVVSLADGTILAEHDLPCQPITPSIIGDYTNDGLNDVIIACPLGYFGFVLESERNYVYMGILSVAVVLTIMLLTWCFKPDQGNEFYEEHYR